MSAPFATLVAAAALSLCASLAAAQTVPAAPSPKPMAPATAPAAAGKPAMSPKGAECSKLADAKGLHGRPRRKFRSACKRGKMQG
jgi:hypothetical protein